MPFLRTYQKVILVGNVTRDPDLRYTASNTPVARFSVATNRVFTNAQGERKEETQFHRVVVWGKFAEKIAEILKKGYKVLIEGRLEYREIRDEAGKLTARDVSIRADEIIILYRPRRDTAAPTAEERDQQPEVDLDSIAEQIASEGADAKEEAATEEAPAEGQKEAGEDSTEELPF